MQLLSLPYTARKLEPQDTMPLATEPSRYLQMPPQIPFAALLQDRWKGLDSVTQTVDPGADQLVTG